MITFKGKTAVVTGAAGGIGRAVCRMMHGAGARLVIADLDEAGATRFAEELDPMRDTAVAIRHDARSSEDAERVMALAVERHGAIDILVTAAGLFPLSPILETDDETWRNVLAINLDGVLYSSRAAVPRMADGGSMVHIASVAGHKGAQNHAHYATAKGGVLALARSLAVELAPRDIRVNAVSPGIIATTMTDDLMARRGDIIIANTPMARMGTAEEVAGVICFLASDLASFVTGETVHVNGGYYIAS